MPSPVRSERAIQSKAIRCFRGSVGSMAYTSRLVSRKNLPFIALFARQAPTHSKIGHGRDQTLHVLTRDGRIPRVLLQPLAEQRIQRGAFRFGAPSRFLD